MSVVGLDFGVKNAVIAAAGRGGVDVILNGNSNRLNPAMVGFDQCRSMGEGAGISATSNYKNTIFNMKRLVGLGYDDPRAQAEMLKCPFTCVPFEKQAGGPASIGVKVNLNGEEKIVSMEAVAGMMMRHMGGIAAAKAAANSNATATEENLFPQDWVIAIPSYFTDAQRRALLVSAEISGIQGVQRLMHEHTAVALSYGIFKDIRKEFTKDEPTNVMFIDMGATSYSVSIVSFEPGKLVVKSCFYDENLGGRDFDAVIAEWIAQKFEEKFKGKLSAKPMEKPKVRIKLLTAAEKAKKTLSPHGVKESRISLECLMDDFDFATALKAEEYEMMCKPLLDRLAAPIEKALAEAKLTADDLASVEVVGGSTRIGAVKSVISSVLGGNKTLSTTMNADEAVARGAALQSAILSPRFKVLPYEIQEAQPYPIKLTWDESSEDGSVVMFDRGLNFPIVRRVTLKRDGEFAVSASYDAASSNYGFVDGVSSDICTFNIKATADGELKKIRVNVKEDIHGIINLSSAQMVEDIVEEEAAEEGAAKEAEASAEKKEGEAGGDAEEKKKKVKKTNLEVDVVRPLDWSKEEINKAYEEEVAMANGDRIVRETADMRNELESYIYDKRDKITSESQLAPFATDGEKSTFSTALESTENWLYEDGFDASKSVYAEKLAELQKIGNPIERRQVEAGARPASVAKLQRNVEFYSNWLNTAQSDEKYAHITEEEFQRCRAKCDEVSSWMYDMLDKQGSLGQNVDPAVTVADLSAKSKEVTDCCNPVMHKPAPKKEEPKKEEAAEAANAGAEEKAAPEPMETEEKTEEGAPTPMETD